METIYCILAKYFKHHCSEEELEVVEAWKTKNLAEFEQLRALWDLSDGHEFIQFDEQKGWEELKIQIENTSSLNSSKPIIKPLFKYLAAASVLVAALVTVVQINSQQQLPSLAVDDNAIEITKDVRGDALESKELIAQTTLTNGQTVWLNKHSQLEDFVVENNRYQINLVRGTAFFDLKTASSDVSSRFKIKAAGLNIEFKDAIFSVEKSQNHIKVFLQKGSVNLITDDLQQLQIVAGQSATFQQNQLTSSTSFSINELAWKTGVFDFDEMQITEAIDLLETHYPVQIDYLAPKSYALEVTFDQEPLADILQHFVDKYPLQLEEVDKDVYYILSDIPQ